MSRKVFCLHMIPVDTYEMTVTLVTDTSAIIILVVTTVASAVRANVVHSHTSRATR